MYISKGWDKLPDARKHDSRLTQILAENTRVIYIQMHYVLCLNKYRMGKTIGKHRDDVSITSCKKTEKLKETSLGQKEMCAGGAIDCVLLILSP